MTKDSGPVAFERQLGATVHTPQDAPRVTAAEMAVLRLLACGASYKEIAAARSVSPKTVDHQMQCLFRKFGVRSRGELVAQVLARGIVILTRV